MNPPPIRPSARVASLGAYAFAELDRLRDQRLAAGADVIDLGVGDPTDPVPEAVVQAALSALGNHRRSGYPSYVGSAPFRTAVSAWLRRRFGVTVDPTRGVTATVGSKEAVFHLPEAFVDPGDVVLVPSPGYPPYSSGTRFAEGVAVSYPVTPDGPLLPDLDRLAPDVAARLRVVWITQPHVPTGRSATVEELACLAAQCRERGVLLCSDEAYSELWLDSAPASVLQAASQGVLVFQSLSKMAAMTGYRVGFVAGDEEAVTVFRRLKTNVDSGTPDFVQAAAIAALEDPDVAAGQRAGTRERIEVLLPALREVGCTVARPSAGFYLWAQAPGGQSGIDFAMSLLSSDAAIVAMPGEWLAEPVVGQGLPGAGRVRFALVQPVARCAEAAERLRAWKKGRS